MANIYVRSTDGNNADSGATWALAKADIVGAAAIDAGGDTVWLSQAHAETTAAAIAPSWNATSLRILCGDDAAEPPTALATAATITTTGNSNITIGAAGQFYGYGFSIIAGSGASGTATIALAAAGRAEFESCNFQLASTGTASRITTTSSNRSVLLRNCGFKFAAAAQGFEVAGAIMYLDIEGGSLLSGGTSPTAFLVGTGSANKVRVYGLDLTNANAAINLAADSSANNNVSFVACKLPASWSGQLNSSTPGNGSVYEMINCDSGATNYIYQRKTFYGLITSETTLVRTGGASDGTTSLSWKMASNASAGVFFPVSSLETGKITIWNDTVGSSVTATVELLHDSVTALKDNEIWIEVRYPSSIATPLGAIASSAMANVLATPANVASSSVTWMTTGMTNPNKQKMSVSFTPQMKGPVYVTVYVAKASYTVYVDPVVTLS
jgi:hypothetical protein